MKLETVINVFPSLAELAKRKLPAKTAYRMAKNYTAMLAEVQAFETHRSQLLTSLGMPREDDPTTYDLAPANATEFRKQMTDLLAEDVDIEPLTVTLDDLGDLDIEPSMLIPLADIIIVGC